jgi:hypothetical protein
LMSRNCSSLRTLSLALRRRRTARTGRNKLARRHEHRNRPDIVELLEVNDY